MSDGKKVLFVVEPDLIQQKARVEALEDTGKFVVKPFSYCEDALRSLLPEEAKKKFDILNKNKLGPGAKVKFIQSINKDLVDVPYAILSNNQSSNFFYGTHFAQSLFGANIPFVFLTGDDVYKDDQAGRKLEKYTQCEKKPFLLGQILSAINSAVEKIDDIKKNGFEEEPPAKKGLAGLIKGILGGGSKNGHKIPIEGRW